MQTAADCATSRKRSPFHGGSTRKADRIPRTRWVRGSPRGGAVIAMSEISRSVDANSAVGSGRLEKFDRSRPSKTNCTSANRAVESDDADSDRMSDRFWWKEKNRLVDEFVDEYPNRAARPVSVRGGTKLREEATLDRRGDTGGDRSKSWSSVLNEFFNWYNGYRSAHLVFKDPDGKRVRAQMFNSHMPEYGDRYYARLKAFEESVIKDYSNPHVVMLTLTGSHKNANDGWRAPADHLRDVVDSWRPDRGRGVYHALRDTLSGYEWEYAIVHEPHKSGYGHSHVAVFVDGEVEKADFHKAIDAHLRVCDIAGKEAHDYFHPDPKKRPISLNKVD